MKHWVVVLCCVGIICVALACTKRDAATVAQIAISGDAEAAKRLAARKTVYYISNPQALERDIQQFKKDFAAILAVFKKEVEGEWGKDEVKEPKPKEYVKYTQNYLSRASVNFDTGIIIVETVDQEKPLDSLKNATVTTLLTPNDPRAVDLYSASTIQLGETPFLFGEVKDHENADIRWAWRAERFADHLLKADVKTRQISLEGKNVTVHYLTIAMVKDHLHVRAKKYLPVVEKVATKYGVSKNLIFAVMQTESDFNPYAASPAPAFGLMQIVPTSAGREVHKHVTGKDGIPTKDFLFDTDNNILYGGVYLHLLKSRHLNAITHPLSLEYCVIAAYNTGAGNVYKTFDPDRAKAPKRINNLTPLEVLAILKTKLPYEETRRYLGKVLEAKKDFINL